LKNFSNIKTNALKKGIGGSPLKKKKKKKKKKKVRNIQYTL